MKRMLLVFPHPDDESFTCGGTIPKYVKNGWEVHLLCATRGEVGNRGIYGDISDKALGAIRQRELGEVVKYLKIKSVKVLDYTDGSLSAVPAGELEDTVFTSMRTLTPSVVITFETGGISNHPDHIKLTRAATVAFQRYAETIVDVREKGIGSNRPPRHARDSWQIEFAKVTSDFAFPKLYFASMPESVGNHLVRTHVFPERMFGKPWSMIPDKFITTVIDTHAYETTKIRALRLHVTQTEDVERILKDSSKATLMHEFFVLRMWGRHEVFMGKHDRVADRL